VECFGTFKEENFLNTSPSSQFSQFNSNNLYLIEYINKCMKHFLKTFDAKAKASIYESLCLPLDEENISKIQNQKIKEWLSLFEEKNQLDQLDQFFNINVNETPNQDYLRWANWVKLYWKTVLEISTDHERIHLSLCHLKNNYTKKQEIENEIQSILINILLSSNEKDLPETTKNKIITIQSILINILLSSNKKDLPETTKNKIITILEWAKRFKDCDIQHLLLWSALEKKKLRIFYFIYQNYGGPFCYAATGVFCKTKPFNPDQKKALDIFNSIRNFFWNFQDKNEIYNIMSEQNPILNQLKRYSFLSNQAIQENLYTLIEFHFLTMPQTHEERRGNIEMLRIICMAFIKKEKYFSQIYARLMKKGFFLFLTQPALSEENTIIAKQTLEKLYHMDLDEENLKSLKVLNYLETHFLEEQLNDENNSVLIELLEKRHKLLEKQWPVKEWEEWYNQKDDLKNGMKLKEGIYQIQIKSPVQNLEPMDELFSEYRERIFSYILKDPLHPLGSFFKSLKETSERK